MSVVIPNEVRDTEWDTSDVRFGWISAISIGEVMVDGVVKIDGGGSKLF